MSRTSKKKSGINRDRKEIRFGGVHIDLIGPADLAHNEEAKDAAIDFLRTEILATQDRLKDCGKINPVLKRTMRQYHRRFRHNPALRRKETARLNNSGGQLRALLLRYLARWAICSI